MDRPVVKDRQYLERDTSSKAILNKDDSAYARARSRKKLKKESHDLIKDLVARIETLEYEVEILKTREQSFR